MATIGLQESQPLCVDASSSSRCGCVKSKVMLGAAAGSHRQ